MSNKTITFAFEKYSVDYIVTPETANSILECIGKGHNALFNPLNWNTDQPTGEDVLVRADKVLYVKVGNVLAF